MQFDVMPIHISCFGLDSHLKGFCFLGLAISAVMKFIDSIVKVMLTALSVVLTTLFEAFYLGEVPSLPTILGGTLIMFSVVAWSKAPRQVDATQAPVLR